MGTARGDGHNSFVVSFMATIDSAYQLLLQELHAWIPRAPKMPTSEPVGGVAEARHSPVLSAELPTLEPIEEAPALLAEEVASPNPSQFP
jgi:hypothetical protein